MKARVIGWAGHHNIGDDSFKISFSKIFEGVDFRFSDAVDLAEPTETVILGGGDIFNRHYVESVLKVPADRRYAISVSAHRHTPLELLHKFDRIIVRDLRSIEFLHSNGIEAHYMPDVSLCLSGDAEKGKTFIRGLFAGEKRDLYEKTVGICFNAHLFSGKSDMLGRDLINYNYVASRLARVIDETSASFVFFPMSTGMPHDDRVTNAFLANCCKFWKKNFVIYDRLDVQRTMDVIAACDAVLSSRFHASLFSLSSNVPFVDLTHHDKNSSFLKTIGLEDMSVSYWNFDADKCKDMIKSALGNSAEFGETHKDRLKGIYGRQLEILRRESNNVRFS